jgi:hypothetical protein
MLEYEAKSLKIHVLLFLDYQKAQSGNFLNYFRHFFKDLSAKTLFIL